MARKRNGVSTALGSARVICRMVRLYGTSAMTSRLSPEFAAAAQALALACMALEAVDDYVDVIDRTVGGTGEFAEDVPVGLTTGSDFLEAQNLT